MKSYALPISCNAHHASLAAVAATVLLFAGAAGCQTGGSRPQNAQMSTSITMKALPDASLDMEDASEVKIPAGWRAVGQVSVDACSNLASASWQTASPDGQIAFIMLPSVGWRWGRGAQFGKNCIPFNRLMSAMQVLQQFTGRMRGVKVVGAMPIDDAYRRREVNFTNNSNANNGRVMPQLRANHVGDVAAIRLVDSSGAEMRLRAWVQCADGGMNGGNCFARIDIVRAPKGRLDSVVSMIDGNNMVQEHPTQQWQTAYTNRQQQIAAGQMDILRHNADAGSKLIHDKFVSDMERQQHEHEAFMNQMQSSTNSSMNNANASMNARSTAASDMRDYAADQQTVSGANGTYKTSSQFSNVWSSPYGPPLSDGRTFGSMDNTIDPNSATDNTFTKDQKVHGNGRPQ